LSFHANRLAHEAEQMDITYDIFRKDHPDKPPVWVESVKGLSQAKKRMKELAARTNYEYVLWDASSGKFITSD
jgi:sugar-specific transcriptional regulator TrmB